MAKIRPAPRERRETHRVEDLQDDQQRQYFDELARLIDDRCQDLDWYHRVGELTLKLCPEGQPGYHGKAGAVRLALALGPKEAFLRKTMRIVELYPPKNDVKELNANRVEWTRLKLSFAIKKPKARLKMLIEAQRRQWRIADFHREVQRRYPTGRKGLGGHPGRPLEEDTRPETALDKLLTESRAWLHIHSEAWEKQSNSFRTQIKRLIRKADEAKTVLSKIKAACRKLSW